MFSKIIAALVATLAMLGLTGCSGEKTQPQATTPITVGIPASMTATPSTSTSTMSDDERKWHEPYLKAWGTSPQRKALFHDADIAKFIVAKALETGKFGTPDRYNNWKADWVKGQVGWGGIAVNAGGKATQDKPGAYAWVYFRADGSIDYSKGVKGFSIDMGSEFQGVQIEDESFTKGIPYDVLLDKSAASNTPTYTTCFEHCKPREEGGDFITALNSQELAGMETSAIKALGANMVRAFGSNWRSTPVWRG